MKTLIMYLGMAAVGYMAAIPFRKHKEKFKFLGPLLSAVVCTIVFTMGFRIGSNEEIIANISSIGIYSVILCIVPLAATIAALHFVRKLLGFNDCGLLESAEAAGTPESAAAEGKSAEVEASAADMNPAADMNSEADLSPAEAENKGGKKALPKSTLRIAIAVATGAVFGYLSVIIFGVIDSEVSYRVSGIYITVALYTMVCLVGVDLGLDGTAVERFKKSGLRIIAFPVVTGLATVAAVLLCNLFMPFNMKEALSIACTFCWYSLGPNIIMDAGLITAGAVAFLANFFRVLLSLFIIPIIAKKVGYIETIGMPIAASMDVCIATIEGATNKTTAIYAFVSGCVYTAAVPLLVPLIVG